MANARYDTPYEACTRWAKSHLSPLLGSAVKHMSLATMGQQQCHWAVPSTAPSGAVPCRLRANQSAVLVLDPAIKAVQAQCPAGVDAGTWEVWVAALAALAVWGVSTVRTAGGCDGLQSCS
jgi:hypothetical protein